MKSVLGIDLVDIPIEELIKEISVTDKTDLLSLTQGHTCSDRVGKDSLYGAALIYQALNSIVSRYGLSGFTLRCFDLLDTVHNTGCLALAGLNSRGIVAGCEGDIPAMLSMAVSQALFDCPGFQSNPSRIDIQTHSLLLVHCTIPFNMLRNWSYDTHFESGIGVAVKGEVREGDVTIFKLSGKLDRAYVSEGVLETNLNEPSLCRTQLLLKLDESPEYFLTQPIGNHHIVIEGHKKEILKAFLERIGINCK
ncbi:protein containing L-fucose isomerase-like protein [gut metagenome]|uniref:Protein containing L-fucose isomerase-like protein n=1 Tax=gut metagenome TaxID=749906 RepID=J9CCH9_9ZZZZ